MTQNGRMATRPKRPRDPNQLAKLKLRAMLDRLNDIEATIARVEAQAKPEFAFATRASLTSLENRRDMLREELLEIAASISSFPDGG